MHTILSVFALALVRSAEWDYKTNGADWPDLVLDGNKCGGDNQSPIDLPKRVAESQMISPAEDNFQKMYSDQLVDIEVAWNGHTSQTSVLKDSPQIFSSRHVFNEWDGPMRFEGQQFHFHSGSEHTVAGSRFDLEMHTVHYPQADSTPNGDDSEFIAAAMGIIFDTRKYDEGIENWQLDVIDNFFDNLKWEETGGNPKVEEVSYGELMMMVNMDTRWVYKGSVTTPPCATTVYWNVCRTVYPIQQKHLDLFLNQLGRKENLRNYGNYREIQETTDKHDVMIIDYPKGDMGLDDEGSEVGWEIATVILGVLSGAMFVVTICFAMRMAKTQASRESQYAEK